MQSYFSNTTGPCCLTRTPPDLPPAAFLGSWKPPCTTESYKSVGALVSDYTTGPQTLLKTLKFIIKDLNYVTLSVVPESVNLTHFYFPLLALSIFNLKGDLL